MRPEDRDLAYLWDMREAAREVTEFVRDVTFEQYQTRKVVRRAVERQIEVIGEAASHVSKSFQDRHPEIPWRLIIGQRNVLAHDYGEILDERIYRVAVGKIPELERLLTPLIPPVES
jgi:uncharacterized protein with HEPN domain